MLIVVYTSKYIYNKISYNLSSNNRKGSVNGISNSFNKYEPINSEEMVRQYILA